MLRELIADMRQQITGEERDILPRLRDSLPRDQLLDLGTKMLLAQSNAPTRPHPTTPDTPPANLLIDPGVGYVDRMRDALSGDHSR